MASEDYEFYKGLVYLMEHPIQDMGTELTFCLEVQEFGVTTIRDLISNGRNIPVTEENKLEYIRLVCQLKMSGSIRQQLDAFLDGFYDLIPQRLISIFNEQELELLISGLPTIDIDDLKQNTEYHKYHINSIQVNCTFSNNIYFYKFPIYFRLNGFGVLYVVSSNQIELISYNLLQVHRRYHYKVFLH